MGFITSEAPFGINMFGTFSNHQKSKSKNRSRVTISAQGKLFIRPRWWFQMFVNFHPYLGK